MADLEQTGFAQGVAWATQVLLSWDQETLALDLLNESGLTLEQLEEVADEYDLTPIRAALPQATGGENGR